MKKQIETPASGVYLFRQFILKNSNTSKNKKNSWLPLAIKCERNSLFKFFTKSVEILKNWLYSAFVKGVGNTHSYVTLEEI